MLRPDRRKVIEVVAKAAGWHLAPLPERSVYRPADPDEIRSLLDMPRLHPDCVEAVDYAA